MPYFWIALGLIGCLIVFGLFVAVAYLLDGGLSRFKIHRSKYENPPRQDN